MRPIPVFDGKLRFQHCAGAQTADAELKEKRVNGIRSCGGVRGEVFPSQCFSARTIAASTSCLRTPDRGRRALPTLCVCYSIVRRLSAVGSAEMLSFHVEPEQKPYPNAGERCQEKKSNGQKVGLLIPQHARYWHQATNSLGL